MVQQPTTSNDLFTEVDHHLVLFPTRSPAYVATEFLARSADRRSAGRRLRVRTHVIRQVVVLEVAGRLGDVVEELDREVQVALADGPRGVVCDLSAVIFEGGAEPAAVEALATVGRHVRDWPGVAVAVACPDLEVREALSAHPLGGQLILTVSMFCAVSEVLATPPVATERISLPPHPTAPRASRDFVTRTLLEWGLGQLVFSATLVVSELVASSTTHAGTDIDLSVAWSLGALRLSVRDSRPDLPLHAYTRIDRRGPRVTAVAGLSRASGLLPTADGGKVVWAVLNAARPRSRRAVPTSSVVRPRR